MSRRRAVTIATPADLRPHRRCPGHKVRPESTWSVVHEDIDSTPRTCPETIAPAPVPPIGGELAIAFHTPDASSDVPPAFYAGQSIPTILAFTLPPGSSLPFALNPSLTLSLTGTLRLTDGGTSRTLIDISVSLAEGLELWARDASVTTSSGETAALMDSASLPAGSYTLPLSAQVPSSPGLPPTFDVAGAAFSLTYSLCVSLTCDLPASSNSPPRRALVAHSAAGFELLPSTLPSVPPLILPHSFWVPSTSASSRPTERWVLNAALPTGTYSPTSVIPLELRINPPQSTAERGLKRDRMELEWEDGYGSETAAENALASWQQPCDTMCSLASACGCNPMPTLVGSSHAPRSSSPHPSSMSADDTAIIARVALVREERLDDELVSSSTILARIGWEPLSRQQPVTLRPSLPLMLDSAWTHGFSTVLAVDGRTLCAPPGMDPSSLGVNVSSTFHLRIDILFLSGLDSQGSGLSVLDSIPGFASPGFSPPLPGRESSRLWSTIQRLAPAVPRSLVVPLVIGSVAEPRDAMYTHRWSDLSLDANGEPATLVDGEDISCENGWIVPPPSYACAIQSAPYVY